MQTKHYFFKSMLIALMAMLHLSASAQESTTLAEWNMEQSDDITATWFSISGAPQIAPDVVEKC